jgi:hypothetical protein
MKIGRPMRKAVASTSTGEYYHSVASWFSLLEIVLGRFGYITQDENFPQVHTNEGYAILNIHPEDNPNEVAHVWWSWYRMPSGNWEVVCYVT